jgi:hypothetical protein
VNYFTVAGWPRLRRGYHGALSVLYLSYMGVSIVAQIESSQTFWLSVRHCKACGVVSEQERMRASGVECVCFCLLFVRALSRNPLSLSAWQDPAAAHALALSMVLTKLTRSPALNDDFRGLLHVVL